MNRYFIAANVWLVFSVVAFFGRTGERSDPVMYSFLHTGHWFYGGSYMLVVGGLFALSLFFFAATWRTRKSRCHAEP
jgi:hypothetical protein